MRRILITGGAGFIGSHLVDHLLAEGGWEVTVVDNFDPFYNPLDKQRNIAPYRDNARFRLIEEDIRNLDGLRRELKSEYDVVVHLAAKAGVRPSLADPVVYQEVNVQGTQNILELAKEWGIPQFIFGSSSSVYGVNPNVPWREDDPVLMPISPYAATKVSGELLGHVYSHLYGIRFVGLRFFTVYGPRQRPDLAIHKFTKLMLQGQPVPVFGDGSTSRDYTYVNDIVSGIRSSIDYNMSMYEIINLGNNKTVTLDELIKSLERTLGVEACSQYHPPQPGDVPRTFADISKADRLLNFRPKTMFEEGLREFARWLREKDMPIFSPR